MYTLLKKKPRTGKHAHQLYLYFITDYLCNRSDHSIGIESFFLRIEWRKLWGRLVCSCRRKRNTTFKNVAVSMGCADCSTGRMLGCVIKESCTPRDFVSPREEKGNNETYNRGCVVSESGINYSVIVGNFHNFRNILLRYGRERNRFDSHFYRVFCPWISPCETKFDQ